MHIKCTAPLTSVKNNFARCVLSNATSVTSAKRFERFNLCKCGADDGSQQQPTNNIRDVVCASVIYSIVFDLIFFFPFENLFPSSSTHFNISFAEEKPFFFFSNSGDYNAMTLLLVRVVWIVPNHSKKNSFFIQFYFPVLLLHSAFDDFPFSAPVSPIASLIEKVYCTHTHTRALDHLLRSLLSACSISCDEGYARP